MTADAILARLVAGQSISGRHVLVTAHADDETISASAALCAVMDPILVQLTERRDERAAALEAGDWSPTVVDLFITNRETLLCLRQIATALERVLDGADVVWTHPYEGGHLDHDSAAWAVAMAVSRLQRKPLHLEFASYHLAEQKRHAFGEFWPDAGCPVATVRLDGARFERKLAAVRAYGSQAHILKKFPAPAIEPYRVAPRYDFSRPSPPPRSRWDVKGYTPSTATWRVAAEAA